MITDRNGMRNDRNYGNDSEGCRRVPEVKMVAAKQSLLHQRQRRTEDQIPAQLGAA